MFDFIKRAFSEKEPRPPEPEPDKCYIFINSPHVKRPWVVGEMRITRNWPLLQVREKTFEDVVKKRDDHNLDKIVCPSSYQDAVDYIEQSQILHMKMFRHDCIILSESEAESFEEMRML